MASIHVRHAQIRDDDLIRLASPEVGAEKFQSFPAACGDCHLLVVQFEDIMQELPQQRFVVDVEQEN